MMRRLKSGALALLVLAAVAALPASASASELVSGGTTVPVGTEVTGTDQSGAILFNNTSGEAFLACGGAKMTAVVTRNPGKTYGLNTTSFVFTGPGVEEKCKAGPYGDSRFAFLIGPKTPACTFGSTSGSVSSLTIQGGSCEVPGSLRMTMESPVVGTCYYRAESDRLDFLGNAGTEPLIFHTNGEQRLKGEAGNSGLCPGGFNLNIGALRMKTAAGADLMAK